MELERFRTSPIGRLVPITVAVADRAWRHEAFVPDPLPLSRPPLSDAAWARVVAASSALGRLDGAAKRLPNPYLLVRPALAEEAVSTSALEGTYAALEDVLQAEFLDPADVGPATVEVRNYITAAELGLSMIKELPICHRLVKDLHRAR